MTDDQQTINELVEKLQRVTTDAKELNAENGQLRAELNKSKRTWVMLAKDLDAARADNVKELETLRKQVEVEHNHHTARTAQVNTLHAKLAAVEKERDELKHKLNHSIPSL